MSRCVTLLMQVLKETNDGRMLMQLSMQLGKIPESDKYILNKIKIYFIFDNFLTLFYALSKHQTYLIMLSLFAFCLSAN